ncbi:S9 family peptidase [Aggregatimonas sangjinii]|uniref:S9 family peptidase n=1 Tax=Aggregatimonas sangjinii TaxID=2583587 RepID=A0A5B7SNX2_9FLAO|nr:S9 family peptidase [Aggregatimonas sangjinii]QCW98720.1 S9 family peptidase [Aggregatimonas sangjinii]
MRKTLLPLLCIVAFISFATAQKKQITVEEIYNGAFRTEGMDALRSLKNGKQYTILNRNRSDRTTAIDKYDYKTQKKVETVLSSADLEAIDNFESYAFNADETKILLATELEDIYRRSKLGVYYVYDIATKTLTKISDSKIQEPTLSPDGKQVAYASDNNLYLFDIQSKTAKPITTDGEKNKIINGITDWVYEEEFAFVRAYDWNSDGSKIAYLRFDETDVPQFSMDVFGTGLYPTEEEFKYPKAGEENATVSLHLYDVASGTSAEVDLGNAYYVPRIKWMNHPNYLSVQTLNRHQNHLKLLEVNAKDNSVSLLMEEKDDAYIDITDNLTFLADDSFIWTSENDGFNHIYLYDSDGNLMNQITKGEWEVTDYYGYDQKNDKVYYQSTENGSINRDVYSISSSGKNKKRLSEREGQNSADFSADFSNYINTFSSASTPFEYTLHSSSNGKKLKNITTNDALLDKLKGYEMSPKEFSTININGNDLHMYMIKPANFDPNKEYPLLMFQYSGPGSQQVSNRWMGANDYWHQMLASEGYVIACVDGRGTGFKGADFKKSTYMNLVKYETEDQIAAARKLSELPYIDEERTGIWGWSFGGHMSTNALLKGSDVFEMAIAVAPVTSWRFYDTIYTERFMRTPAENPSGYDDNSPFNYPEKLQGKYLLVHGSGDDNVHLQNTMRMVEALIQANKQFEWAIYPDKNHGIYGGNTRIHLFNKMTDFIHENLGKEVEGKTSITDQAGPIKG